MHASSILPPVDVHRAAANDSLLRAGRELFRANCVSCHGDNGQGDGPAGPLAESKAPELPCGNRMDKRSTSDGDLPDAA